MKITTTLKSIAHIEAEAVKAAQKYTSINDACPYPFGSTSARIFRLAFAKALAKSIITPPVRERMNAQADLHAILVVASMEMNMRVVGAKMELEKVE